MSDYKERFDKWQKDAKEKFEEIDKQLGLKDKIEEGARVVVETAQKGAEKIKAEAEKTEVGKQAVKAAEATIKTAEDTAKKAWNASEPIRDAAEDAGDKAGDAVKEAGKTAGEVIDIAGKTAGEVINIAGKKAGQVFDDAYETVGKNATRVSKAFSFGASWTRTIDSAMSAFSKTIRLDTGKSPAGRRDRGLDGGRCRASASFSPASARTGFLIRPCPHGRSKRSASSSTAI